MPGGAIGRVPRYHDVNTAPQWDTVPPGGVLKDRQDAIRHQIPKHLGDVKIVQLDAALGYNPPAQNFLNLRRRGPDGRDLDGDSAEDPIFPGCLRNH